MEILNNEKRRARNLIWNAAEDYTFEPDFKAYDQDGRADRYWNSIIGTVRKDFGPDAFADLFQSFEGDPQQSTYEQVVWLGLENAAYLREAPNRPALPSLRRHYAQAVLALPVPEDADPLLGRLQQAHYRRVLGEADDLSPQEREVLDTLEFPGNLDQAALEDRARGLLETYFGFVPGQGASKKAAGKKWHRRFKLFGRNEGKGELPGVRAFGYGYAEHLSEDGGRQVEEFHSSLNWSGLAVKDDSTIRTYIQNYFGQPLYDQTKTKQLEASLCVDEHKECHLYYARGSAALDPSVKGYVGQQRRAAIKQMEKNRAFYQADLTRNRNSVNRLTARIRNALLTHLEPTEVRSSSGTLDAGRIWRGLYLDDDKVFTKVLKTDPGGLSVDILLDASTSQLDRQETVAAQGYMIAESLTRCGIPVRVSAFCSLSGYTVLTRYRDYQETDQNDRIFRYFTTGCNRDGLAIRALGKEMEDSPCEHRMVILLSDAKPHDIKKLVLPNESLDYSQDAGVNNTAAEVRSLMHRDIAVVCVFTGDDEDVPAAHTIYGRNFARIRSLDQFADTVGTLIQTQIRNL